MERQSSNPGFHLEKTRVSVFEELLKVAGAKESDGQVQDVAAAVGQLSSKELEEIRTMKSPPPILRRTLEATWLLLNASKNSGALGPPTWPRVQRMLSDAGFLSRIQSFDVDALRQSPELSTYIVAEYFGLGERTPTRRHTMYSSTSFGTSGRKSTFVEAGRRSFTADFSRTGSKSVTSELERPARRTSTTELGVVTPSPDEPLTFQRVHRASHAASALFRWCTTALVEVMDPEPEKPKEDICPVPAQEVEAEPEPQEPEWVEEPPLPATPPKQPEAVDPPPVLPSLTTRAVATLAAAVEASVSEPAPQQKVQSSPVAAPILPKPAKAKAAPRVKPAAATLPDRHFELLAAFDLGNARVSPSAEASFQTVAATLVMRPALTLELQACPDKKEHDALSKARLNAAQFWFADNAQSSSICHDYRVAKSGEEPGIVCRILLNKARPLRDYFILRDNPPDDEEIVFARDVKRDALLLEEDFKTCKH